jgi:hypothetical protein
MQITVGNSCHSSQFPPSRNRAQTEGSGASCARWSPAPFTAHCFANYRTKRLQTSVSSS